MVPHVTAESLDLISHPLAAVAVIEVEEAAEAASEEVIEAALEAATEVASEEAEEAVAVSEVVPLTPTKASLSPQETLLLSCEERRLSHIIQIKINYNYLCLMDRMVTLKSKSPTHTSSN